MYKTFRVAARIEGEIELTIDANSPEEAELIAEDMVRDGECAAEIAAATLDVIVLDVVPSDLL